MVPATAVTILEIRPFYRFWLSEKSGKSTLNELDNHSHFANMKHSKGYI